MENLDKLDEFIENSKKASDGPIDKEYFQKRFKDGDFDSKRFKYIEKDGSVVGAISGSKEKPENDEKPTIARLNYYLIDLEHPDAIEIRRNLVGSLYKGFKEEKIDQFIVSIGANSPAKEIFEKIGFKAMNEVYTRFKF